MPPSWSRRETLRLGGPGLILGFAGCLSALPLGENRPDRVSVIVSNWTDDSQTVDVRVAVGPYPDQYQQFKRAYPEDIRGYEPVTIAADESRTLVTLERDFDLSTSRLFSSAILTSSMLTMLKRSTHVNRKSMCSSNPMASMSIAAIVAIRSQLHRAELRSLRMWTNVPTFYDDDNRPQSQSNPLNRASKRRR